MSKHFWLVPLYMAPPLLSYVASTYLAVGDAYRAFPIFCLAALCLAAIYFRGLYLEEQNENLLAYAPTPQWPKRLPKWARVVHELPPMNPPPPLEPATGVRRKTLDWPYGHGNVPRAPTISRDLQAEVTLTEPKAG